jgi:hypothetical protein
LAPLQTDPRFLGLLKETEEETPGIKTRRIHPFERRTNGTKTRRIHLFERRTNGTKTRRILVFLVYYTRGSLKYLLGGY